CPPPACPALTRPPARCFPCALRGLRGSAFTVPSSRNLPREERAAAALTGEISCGYLPEKRRSPLGAGHTRVALRKGVPSEIRAIQIRRKRQWHSMKTQSGLKAFSAKTQSPREPAMGQA